MLPGMLITIREGLEAFLVIGILLGYLTKIQQPRYKRYVWGGTVTALAASVGLTLLFQALAFQFQGELAEAFEAAVAAVAVGVLSWMLLWMQRQSKTIKAELEIKTAQAISAGRAFALATLAFVTVIREGLETALFLSALLSGTKGESPLTGALLGLGMAALIAYLIFATTLCLDLRKFFIVTGLLLIFIAAGLVAHIAMALQEMGLLPAVVEHVWDTSHVLTDESLVGRILHAFIGYHSRPSLLQAIGYLGYLVIFGSRFTLAILESPRKKTLL
ncbi:MAG: FTR1 family protein [candidate division NC10 bacterium]|nr:FTR1 family protein [candidate division NC10 bacterium]